MNAPEGHRDRLRQKFKDNSNSLSDTELLELLLTYVIPRKDVAPIARDLIAHFGGLKAAMASPPEQLMKIDGVGESTVVFMQLIQAIMIESSEENDAMSPAKQQPPSPQLNLFELAPNAGKPPLSGHKAKNKPEIKERTMRVFANDEIVNSLTFLPQVGNFNSLDDFHRYLQEKLPYNAVETRQRRALYILERLFPENDIESPLAVFASHFTTDADLKPVVFYHVLKAEPVVARVADDLIWPALPIGFIDREQIREFILNLMPGIKSATLKKILQAIEHTYIHCEIASASEHRLRFQLHKGSLESFLYILTSEFPSTGIYSFDDLYSGPLHRWMLWDREWIRLQLYNLQDFGILTKVSEIDTVKQFTLAADQPTTLHMFFEHPERKQKAIRERGESRTTDQEN